MFKKFQFVGVSYGSLIICLSRDVTYSPLECKTVEDNNVAEFTITRPCDDIFQCYGLYFSVIVEKSNVRCTGKASWSASIIMD